MRGSPRTRCTVGGVLCADARVWVRGWVRARAKRSAWQLELETGIVSLSGNLSDRRIPGTAAFGGHTRAASPPPATPHAKVLRSSRVCTNSCLVMSPDLSAVNAERVVIHREWNNIRLRTVHISRPPVAHPPLPPRGACLLLSKRSMVSSISSGISPASIPSRVALSSLVLTWFGYGHGFGFGFGGRVRWRLKV